MSNVIIIGGGPAGVSASLYTARAGIETTVFTAGGGSLSKAHRIENYYGFAEPLSGARLLADAIAGARRVGASFVEEEVVTIDEEDAFVVVTANGRYRADCVLLATGVSHAAPNIRGLRALEGRGVSYCAVCDAFFYRGKDVCVLGSGEFALHEIGALLPLAGSVTLLTNGATPTVALPEGVRLNTASIAEICGEARVEAVRFADGTVLETAGIFIAYGVAGSAALARKLGAELSGDTIVVDRAMMTSIPGLYAAGDCTGGLLQIAKAVYEGALAGTEIVRQLRSSSI